LSFKNRKHEVVVKRCILFSFILVSFLFTTSCKKQITDTKASVSELEMNQGLSATNNGNTGESNGMIGINVLLHTNVTTAILNELATYGRVKKVFAEIKALTMVIPAIKLNQIKSLQFVRYANADVENTLAPIDAVAVSDFSTGLSTWNLDAVNVTQPGAGRTVTEDGTGVYVAVLDSGLPDSWRQIFPEERIATQYAKSFGGGGADMGTISEQPNKWEHDQNSHGGHVTSTIIGYNLRGVYFNGVAPKATIIPVKVLDQTGSGWWSVIAEGILYIANLKAGVLRNSPVIINMSLGGPTNDALLSAAIDYAISKGVIIVAAAGNSGSQGMGYPGAYQPVISVAAAAWISHFSTPTWWYAADIADPTSVNDFFIAPFSSRQLAGQDLDVVAPGVAVVGPYQINSGQLEYYFLSGTSMASPHVAGIVALMAQKKPSLTAAEAETILQSVALPMGAGTRLINGTFSISWGANASGSGFITANAALSGL
jgi:subtilisin family serine protease